MNQQTRIAIGIDIGSTTVKAVVCDPETLEILWSDYQRHETRQPEMTLEFLVSIGNAFPNAKDIQIFSYYSLDIGIPLKVCGLYSTRVRVKWLNNSTKMTEEPSTWLQNIDKEGLLPTMISSLMHSHEA